jgi:thiol-disulfide isomerase/thioredoxin
MKQFITALKAEHIKKKGTALYWVAAGLGAFIPLINAVDMIFEDNIPNGGALPYNYYQALIEEMAQIFALFFFPLLIIISISRITQLDHRNGGWQLMETQPLRKFNFYFAKFSAVLVASAIAIVSLVVSCYVFGSLTLLYVEVPKTAAVTFEAIPVLMLMLRLFVAALFFTAVQYLISVLVSSFIWSMLIGFFMLLAFIFLHNSNLAPEWYPLEPLGKVSDFTRGSDLGYWITYSDVVSGLLCALVLYIGFNWYRHKSFKTAFLTPARGGALVAVVALFGGLTAWVLTPNTYDAYGKTIIAGHIESAEKFNMLYITDNFVHDTIAAIPVVNNAFHYEIKQDIPLDSYLFMAGNSLRGFVLLGNKDSIYLDIRKKDQTVDGKITGTRLAENQYRKKQRETYSSAQWQLSQNDVGNVERFTNDLVQEGHYLLNSTDAYKTVDNYVFRDDCVGYLKKLQTLAYLNYWTDFVRKRKALYPGQPTPESPDIVAMKNMVPLDDEGMLSNEDYFNYVRGQLILQNNTDIDEDTRALLAINKMKPGGFKDKMLFWQLKEGVVASSAKSYRDSLVAQYAGGFTDRKYAARLANLNKTLLSLDKGQPAPAIAASGLDKKPFKISDYKGKLVVIDVWATWCGPCKVQSPSFEKMALKYKNQPVAFVALSTDQDITAWYAEARLKSKSVVQVHANDAETFGKDYKIEFIPHFILLDKDGNIISADMPRPNEKAFEETLRRELGLGEEE